MLNNLIVIVLLVALCVDGSSKYRIDVTATCCNRAENSTDLMQCIDDIEPPEIAEDQKRFAIISYASPDIIPYAAYAFAVNSAYAEHNGYEIFFMSPETGSNHEPRDQRWNRVKIIMDALDSSDGWLRDVDYIVWTDADLIFLDFELNMRELTEQNPEVDIIISAERHAGTGVANTGCFIIKNSQWSRDFLKEWWTSFDRTINHDQIFFDILYKRRLPGITKHVKILPTDEINSTPPPTINQKPENKVLHMMGQQQELRQKAFRLGFEEICRAYEEHDDVAPQLGLTQPRLYSMALQYFETDLSRIVAILDDAEKVSALGMEEFDQLTSTAREHVVQIQIYSPTQDNADITYVLYNAARTRALHAETQGKSQAKHMPTLYNSWAVYGNDLAATIPVPEERLKLMSEIEGVLHKLFSVLHTTHKHIATEMLLRLHNSMGATNLELKNFEGSLPHFQKSLDLLEEMGAKRNDIYTVDTLMNMGSAQCMAFEFDDGISNLLKAIDIQEKLLFAEQQMKQDHIQLATLMLRLAGCMAKAGDLRAGLLYSTRAHDILSIHPEKNSVAALLNAWSKIDERLRAELSSPEDLELIAKLERKGSQPLIEQYKRSRTHAGVGGGKSAHDAKNTPKKKKLMRKKKKSGEL
jgi:tetratricopeptide (TPR) repeat protein